MFRLAARRADVSSSRPDMRALFSVRRVPLLVLLALAGGCAQPRGAITQISTIDALLAGSFDGQMTLAALRTHGDFGIGTFDRLDGEMILLDGRFHQARSDGTVTVPSDRLTTPYAMVTRFRPETTLAVTRALDFHELERALHDACPNPNLFCAVRAKGHFRSVTFRSVPPQKKPYPLLLEASRHQAVFQHHDLDGTLIGFRSPAYVKGVAVPGCHFHFISDDGRVGGHVLECVMDRGEIAAQACARFTMILPQGESDFDKLDLSRDRSRELEKVEK